MAKESVYYNLSDLSGKHDVKNIKKELDTFPGVLSVSVNEEKNSVAVDFDSTGVSAGRIAKKLEELGYTVEDFKIEPHAM